MSKLTERYLHDIADAPDREHAYAAAEAIANYVVSLKEMLERVQWIYDGTHDEYFCYFCGNYEYQGHKLNCELHEKIKEKNEDHS